MADPVSPRIEPLDESVTVSFSNMDFAVPSTVRTSKKLSSLESPTIHILKNVSGELKPKRLTCIMGPSGSGKTTLLNLIAGRQSAKSVKGCKLSGSVSLNGCFIDPTLERERFAFVTAHDALSPTLTPREIFEMTLKLSSDSAMTKVKLEERVDYLLQSLRLSACADTLVGNLEIKGLSSGEKKRVSVGMEMIHEPNIFILDEPTSGLDSHSALVLVDLLKKIADSGRTVFSSIHQPSSEVFRMFDEVAFMASGEIIYFGPVDQVTGFCEKIGHPCPTDSNPSDHVMLLLNSLPSDELRRLAETYRGERKPLLSGQVMKSELRRKRYAGFSLQLWELGKREWINFIRDTPTLQTRFGIAVVLVMVESFVFWQVGSKSNDYYIDVSHVGGVTMMLSDMMFTNSMIQLLNFPSERPIFLKEYSSGLYGVAPYFLSKALVEFPIFFAQVCGSIAIAYHIMGLTGSYIGLVYSAFLLSISSSSIALLIASLADDVVQASQLAPVILIPQVFWSGFFIPMSQVPAVLRWAQYICALKYSLNSAYIQEFSHFKPSGNTFLSNNDINTDNTWLYAIILVGITLGFRLLAILALKRRANQIY